MPADGDLARALAPALGVRAEAVAAGLARHASAAGPLAADGAGAFLKRLPAARADELAAEADGLTALAGTPGLRVPAVLDQGVAGDTAYLLMEQVTLRPPRGRAGAALGEAVAALHRRLGPCHGWHRDNYLGGTPQCNRPLRPWAAFYRDRRLQPQWLRARDNGAGAGLLKAVEQVMAVLPSRLGDHDPAPSLLHGDLWAGNAAVDDSGRPVLYDPAVHHGDRECDLAMAALFGGFDAEFDAGYAGVWPLAQGYRERRPLYQLYHLLNHFNLFGGPYESGARRAAEAFTNPRAGRPGY